MTSEHDTLKALKYAHGYVLDYWSTVPNNYQVLGSKQTVDVCKINVFFFACPLAKTNNVHGLMKTEVGLMGANVNKAHWYIIFHKLLLSQLLRGQVAGPW